MKREYILWYDGNETWYIIKGDFDSEDELMKYFPEGFCLYSVDLDKNDVILDSSVGIFSNLVSKFNYNEYEVFNL